MAALHHPGLHLQDDTESCYILILQQHKHPVSSYFIIWLSNLCERSKLLFSFSWYLLYAALLASWLPEWLSTSYVTALNLELVCVRLLQETIIAAFCSVTSE